MGRRGGGGGGGEEEEEEEEEVGQGVLSGQNGICNMTCYIWFERILYADFDCIINVVIRSIYM